MISIWLRKNLFRSVGDSLVTVVFGTLAAYGTYRFLRFIFITGRWDIVRENLSLFVTGSWPTDQLWRLTVMVLALALLGGLAAGFAASLAAAAPDQPDPVLGWARVRDIASRFWPIGSAILLLLLLTSTVGPWLLVLGAIGAGVIGRIAGAYISTRSVAPVVIVFVMFVLAAVWFLSLGVNWNTWGGVILNLFLAAFSITLCFPLGVLLALGRRSEFPIARWLSTAYIELFRGLPLITLLLMANVALGFFIPPSLAPGKIVRALVIFVLFTSAYIAEIVRGGLQSVPRGQVEAGKANGLSPITITSRIVLPQAIRNVIPALVGQFISLFKDTTLVGAAMGLTDLLASSEASTAQDAFRGQALIAETLVFSLLLFWAGSFTMSRESQRLEKKLGVGQR